jgi:hypothetical protein
MNSGSGLWYVQLSDGDVHRVSLDQLDEGFQAGHIDANTMVLPAGARHWTKLGELAGIDEVAPPPAFAAPPALASPQAFAPPPAFAPRPAFAPQAAFAVPAAPLVPRWAPAPLIESHRPVSVDLSDLENVPGTRRSLRKRWVTAAVGVAMIGGLAGVGLERPDVLRLFMSGAHTRAVAAKSWVVGAMPERLLARRPPAPPVTATPVRADTLVPAAPSTPPPAAPNTEPTELPTPVTTPPRAVDDAKPRAHVAGSKAPARKVRPKAPVSADSPSKPPPSFATSGNKFDPLSSTIH